MSIGIIFLRLLVSAVLGGFVGIERENKKRAAGLRTHVLVCIGSALVMVLRISVTSIPGLTNVDPARLGAQVISGIGFLGAGTIIKQGISVQGLTTAASLWAVACIGLATGSGFYSAAIIAAVIVFVTLRSLGKFENVISSNDNSNVEVCVRIENKPGKLGEVASFIGSMGSNITSVDIEEDGDEYLIVSFILKLPKHTTKTDMIVQLQSLNGVSVL